MARILIIDDDIIILKIASAILEKAGHSVLSDVDAFAAMEHLDEELFHLVICDVNMHHVSGFTLITTLRSKPRFANLPVIFLTGRRDKKDVARALDIGADDYIVKPIDNDIFLAKVESLLEKNEGRHSFSNAPIDFPCTWSTEFKITGISEQGLNLISKVPFPLNIKFQVQSELFHEVGISNTQLRVISSDRLLEPKGSYNIKVSFIGLSEIEHQKIRRWVMANRLLKAL